MVRSRRVNTAPPSQNPNAKGGKGKPHEKSDEAQVAQLKAQLSALQAANSKASEIESRLSAQFMAQPKLHIDPARKTPWFPEGAPYPTPLSIEVVGFAQLVSLDSHEQQQRFDVINTIAFEIRRVCPSASVAVQGCFALGLSEPSAPLSLCVENCPGATPDLLSVVTKAFYGHKYGLSPRGHLTLHAVAPNGVVLDLVVCPGRSPNSQAVQLMLSALDEIPIARVIWMVLRHILYHACASLVGREEGALSHEALLAMTIHACRQVGAYTDVAAGFMSFLNLYGSVFDFKASSVVPASCIRIPKIHPGDDVSICAFEDMTTNLAKDVSAKHIRMIRAHLQSFRAALISFDPSTSVTPLSTLIAHRPLWRRVNGKQMNVNRSPEIRLPFSTPPGVSPLQALLNPEMHGKAAAETAMLLQCMAGAMASTQQPVRQEKVAAPAKAASADTAPIREGGRRSKPLTPMMLDPQSDLPKKADTDDESDSPKAGVKSRRSLRQAAMTPPEWPLLRTMSSGMDVKLTTMASTPGTAKLNLNTPQTPALSIPITTSIISTTSTDSNDQSRETSTVGKQHIRRRNRRRASTNFGADGTSSSAFSFSSSPGMTPDNTSLPSPEVSRSIQQLASQFPHHIASPHSQLQQLAAKFPQAVTTAPHRQYHQNPWAHIADGV